MSIGFTVVFLHGIISSYIPVHALKSFICVNMLSLYLLVYFTQNHLILANIYSTIQYMISVLSDILTKF